MTQPDPSLPEDPEQSVTSMPRRRGRLWRWLVFGPFVLACVLAALVLSVAPLVPRPTAPDASDVAAARDVLQQITGGNTMRGDLVRITLSQDELDGLAGLSSQALSPLRMQARLQPPARTPRKTAEKPPRARQTDAQSALVIDMSRQIGWGPWINATAVVRPAERANAAGLPDIAMTLGRLSVPQGVTHWVLERLWLRTQGDTAKPETLARALKRFTVSPRRVDLVLVNPGRGAALAGLAQASGTTPDPKALASVYCAIADTGETNLAVLVRRAAALAAPSDVAPQNYNRVMLTAIAMRAVPEYRDRLAGAARPLIADCPASPEPLTLAGRADLAKHWALSAALTATLGSQVARSMGTWKELADSTQGGSGFSFVDLSADRSGERFAIAALDPQLARAVHARLVAITEDQLLPQEALAKPEGLDQVAFDRDYTAVQSPEFARALRAINRLLDHAGVP